MKMSVVFLSLIILVQSFNIGFSDILKLNELFEHAQFHSEKYGDNFFTFLSKHYGDKKKEHEQDHKEELPKHEKLPFSHLHSHTVDCHSFILATLQFDLNKLSFDEEKETTFFYVDIYSSNHKEGVFQPPKFA